MKLKRCLMPVGPLVGGSRMARKLRLQFEGAIYHVPVPAMTGAPHTRRGQD